ncbi:MAG: PolC-type DNA polymerase III [Oscillospiraceae bacterium]|jgi:DNA polymerase-3 subunit alpha (Gram-positive type)|nr:PolC-type DNA polymerase III [Oscillospiraceae bacterium]
MNWKSILPKDIPPDRLELERVSLTRDGGRMLVRLTSTELCAEGEYLSIKKAFQRAFPQTRVSLRVTSPALAESFLSDPRAYASFLTDCLSRRNPGLRSMLANTTWEIVDGSAESRALTLTAQSAANRDYFAETELPARLSRTLWEVFRLRVSVTLLDRGDLDEQAKRLESLRAQKIEEDIKAAPPPAPREKKQPPPGLVLFGQKIGAEPSAIEAFNVEDGNAPGTFVFEGEALSCEHRAVRGDAWLLSFLLADTTSAVSCKAFLRPGKKDAPPELIASQITPGMYIKVRGSSELDKFTNEPVLTLTDINRAEDLRRVREDAAPDKRVELHLHTQMSSMDGVTSVGAMIARAAAWGHPAIAITDHGVTQAFPEAFAAARKHNIQFIPGMEGYLCDEAELVVDADGRTLDTDIVTLDFETTGLSAERDRVVEIGAVRSRGGMVVEEFSRMVNPGRPMPAAASRVNHITDAMLASAPPFEAIAEEFAAFLGSSPIAAHNAPFDAAFLRAELSRVGIEWKQPVVDTLAMARRLYPRMKSHSLAATCKYLRVPLKDAHRAVNDARATAKALSIMLEQCRAKGARTLDGLNGLRGGSSLGSSYHITILVKNQDGMTRLNRLISEAHLRYFTNQRPRIPRSLLDRLRDGLVLGTACENGELYRAALDGKDDAQLRGIGAFYDFFEIMPDGNNEFLIREGRVKDIEGLRDINRRIIALADALGKPVAATGDAHFLDPGDARYRSVVMAGKGFKDAAAQAPLYFRTTDEMLREFAYLGEAKAREVVIDNPRRIARSLEPVRLFPAHPQGKRTFQPEWPEAAADITERTREAARARYGDPLPVIVEKRLAKELKAIVGYGFATLYSIARKLVAKSLEDGYLVGSRGSVGSSLVATMNGITEVNPLPPHYVCPSCRRSDFETRDIGAGTGVDLPPRDCPDCGAAMSRDGYDIPFEVFLGFEGDKVPDIDLNFSGEYQAQAHKLVEALFGEGHVFRAGTIGTLAEKTALYIVNKYAEERSLQLTAAEKQRLALGCVGVKRTTGQHPGGMVVLPKGYDICQFTAVQRPADDADSDTVTTHYDFASMHDILVKLDILGHDDPTMIRMLEDQTGVNALNIPLGDAKVMSLFTSTEALGIEERALDTTAGTYGIPEFGTRFVRQMLEETRPGTMDELVRISGLSHGTDVWSGNAQELTRSGTATLRECICTREDIMNYLILSGVDTKMAFDTMESVRKGKGLNPDMERAMLDARVPGWIMDSCRKIKYMFPKGHAVAYVTMALRIGWFKVYKPEAYYCAYFTIRAVGFDAAVMLLPEDGLRGQLARLNERLRDLTAKEKDQITMLELALEMSLRGIHFLPVGLYESAADRFRVEAGGIRPPLTALAGLGLSAAQSIIAARSERPFLSAEDLRERSRVSSAVVDLLRAQGCLAGLPETSQMNLFDALLA